MTTSAKQNTLPVPPSTPCLVGTGRATWRTANPEREPLDMWAEVAAAAIGDAADGAGVDAASIQARIDDLGVVHCQAWHYDDPPARLADRLGLRPGRRELSILAGTSPQRLLDSAAVRMRDGTTSVALVVGAEALATRRALAKLGQPPAWSYPHPQPPELPIDVAQWYLPTEIEHGILPAWLTFALLGQARWAARGGSDRDRERMGRIVDHLNAIGAANPDAWFRQRRDAAELCTPTAANRLVATPYTKLMTAYLDVDMAAANLMVTHAVADEWGVPPERRVYLRGCGFARDAVHIGARDTLAASPAMRQAIATALARSSLSVADIDVFDLYSCFPSAVEFALDAMDLDGDDARSLSVTGGLACHGGPGSNYMGHSISHAVDTIRSGRAENALVTGVGMHMTKHVAAVWSAHPGSFGADDDGPQQWAEPSNSGEAARVVDHASGSGRVLAASVVDDIGDGNCRVVAICELADGRRCYATSTGAHELATVAAGGWVSATAAIEPSGSVNQLRL